MKRFWAWFKDKTGFSKEAWIDFSRENWMLNLIGHMEEYLVIKGHFVGLASDMFENITCTKTLYGPERFVQLRDTIDDVISREG